ncbi:retrotransposon hot spot (RHS) protein, putative [Trypanosoma brucei brucei TREU927]|uniref:Retrotransposon hot spot (RHS) protein, putative n=2 Tax=Trypanosoma brucei TaxID=5691 RepID=D7SGB9_TRYB2|nr:retrotransposon hot spot (RHS) protein, putative [Trypanosoma brucei brucei TREU927]AAL14354.1 RHS3a [Trypanosoma brucei]AAQ15580.1 retrotransposon hot spot (RHS) protein, putative [Trypanosoma brucei brucei TREU927]AAX79187.1 retrotransposon hot spot (RHS) protein, putative [Trypanosoma brucei]
MNQQVPIEGRGDIEGRRRENEEAARNDAEPPVVQQRVENNNQPQWGLFSCVDAVLLNGLPHPRNMMLNDFLRRNFGRRYNVNEENNVSMSAFVLEPEEYINDVNALNRIFATTEYKVYKRFVSVYGFFEDEGILNLQRWQQADEEAKVRLQADIRGLRDGERLWIVVTNMLNDALNEARERAAQTACSAVELKGLYESIYNAKWSYVMSGYHTEPLGMKVFDGRPQRMWTEEDVDITPLPANVDAEIEERPDGLEIFVLTSEKGWPYNRFALDYTTGRKVVFQHVYIRREIVRVWYKVEKDLKTWWVEKTAHRPPIHIVIGTPGIGKSYGLGSFLLHSLLHFHEGMLDVVAYFTDTIAYLIYNRKGDERGRVVRYEYLRAAVNAINKMKFENRGHIIMDIRYAMQQLYTQLPSDVWSVTIFTSPNSSHFGNWTTITGGRQIIINCDDVRDMKAFVAWKKLSIHTREKVSNRRRHELRKEMEDEWRIVEGRINSIGLLPRYIFVLSCYEWRLKRVHDALETMKKSDEYSYNDIIEHTAAWKNNEVTEKLVKVVRVKGNVGFIESFKFQALSLMIRNMMMS